MSRADGLPPSDGGEIVLAPFSNSHIRDWPRARWTELVELLLQRVDPAVHLRVIGTAGQRLGADEIVRPHPTARVTNACGRHDWDEVVRRLRAAVCVVGNNSGVAHLGGYHGVPTVCVFGGSHQRLEWAPRGPNVVVVSRAIGCSPCQLDHGRTSPYGKACLRGIEAASVADAAMLVMGRAIREEAA